MITELLLTRFAALTRPFYLRRAALVVMLLIPMAMAVAQPAGRAPRDRRLIGAHPGLALDEIEVEEDANYRLVLGNLKRNRGNVVPEDSLRLRGDVTKLTYQVSRNLLVGGVPVFANRCKRKITANCFPVAEELVAAVTTGPTIFSVIVSCTDR